MDRAGRRRARRLGQQASAERGEQRQRPGEEDAAWASAETWPGSHWNCAHATTVSGEREHRRAPPGPAGLPGEQREDRRAAGSRRCPRCRAGSARASSRPARAAPSPRGSRAAAGCAATAPAATAKPASTTSGWLISPAQAARSGSRASRPRTAPCTSAPWRPRNQQSCHGWKITAAASRPRRRRSRRSPSCRAAAAPRAAAAAASAASAQARRRRRRQRQQHGADREHAPTACWRSPARDRPTATHGAASQRAPPASSTAATHSAAPSSSSGWPSSSARSVIGLATQSPSVTARASRERRAARMRATSQTPSAAAASRQGRASMR